MSKPAKPPPLQKRPPGPIVKPKEEKRVTKEDFEKVLAKIPKYHDQIPYLISFLKPPPKTTISEWADTHRILSSEDSPETGQWVTDKAPYQREMMDAIGDPMVEQVVLNMASQTGKTAGAILNALGYFIDLDPCPILVVYSTVTMAQKVSRQRISPMIRNCPSLRKKIYRTTWRGMDKGSDSLLLKSFPGGMLLLGGAQEPDSLGSFPMRVVLLDEIDRYPHDVGEEGDPVQLAITRTSNFWNRKIILSSTPTIKGQSRIEFALENSSFGRWNLPCPNPKCRRLQDLRWNQIDYTAYAPRIMCKCRYCHEPSSKPRWLAQTGQWVHDHPHRKVRGFHLNAICSPWITWDLLVDEWIKANTAKRRGNNNLLKTFINTRLSETYEDYTLRIEPHILYQRRELYSHIIPDGVYVLTCGADVQDIQKRINYEIVGWGRDYSSWGIEYGTIMADVRNDEWKRIFDEVVINRIFTLLNGKKMRIKKVLMDSNGGYASYVYKYTKSHQPRMFSCKGSSHEREIATNFTGVYKLDEKYNATWYSLNTIMGKDEMFQRLMLMDETQPGFCHFPCGADEDDVQGYTNEYFEGLTSEQKKETVNNLGYTVYKYSKEGATRTSNEPLDCRVYARSALELVEQRMPLHKMTEPDYMVGEGRHVQPIFQTGENVRVREFQTVADPINASEEILANTRGQPTHVAKNHPLISRFGQFGSAGTSIREFDPYREG